MRIARIICLVFAVLLSLLTVPALRAQAPADFRPPLAVLSSPDVKYNLPRAHAVQLLWYAASELKVPADKIPRIIVVHSTADEAAVAGWQANTKTTFGGALVQNSPDGQSLYYVWLVGKPTDEMLVFEFLKVLQQHMGVADQANAAMKRVLTRMGSVVSATDLEKGMFSSTH